MPEILKIISSEEIVMESLSGMLSYLKRILIFEKVI
jgi:hypothetical protein